MYKQPKTQKQAFRFRRFCRAGWAAFRSMHREVTIGRLAARVVDSSLAKGAATVALAVTLSQGTLMAQTEKESETRTLPEVQVMVAADSLFGTPEPAAVLTAEELQHSSARTVGDIVAMLPGIDMRTRGVGDVQADLSMRGGTFDQMVVLLGGINLTDAQTGHHTMDIPVDITMVERVELLTPAQLMARGVTAFCGGVNIVVCEEYRDRLLAQVCGGSYGTADASLLATKAVGPWALTVAGAYHRSDGYRPNTDYRHGSLYVQAARHGERDDWQLQVGGQMKGFGSAGFYSTTYPDQYEATRTLMVSAANVHRFNAAVRLETALYGRLHGDRFELFRDGYVEAPAWYTGHNHHLGSTTGLRGRVMARWGVGEVMAGGEVRREGIWSNVLGEQDSTLHSPYDKAAARLNSTLFAGYSIRFGRIAVEVSALGLHSTSFGFNYGLSSLMTYSTRLLTCHLALSRTYRLPSFTDLYYKSVTQTANPDLGAEHSLAAEAGATLRCKGFAASATAYWRGGRDIIDWVRHTDAEMWYAMNHSEVNAAGVDVSATYSLGGLLDAVGAGYSFCDISLATGQMLSQYSLDHLRHKASAFVRFSLFKGMRLTVDMAFRHRDGFYYADGERHSYGGVLLLNAKAEYEWRHATFFAEGHNLADMAYRDYGGVPMPGRTWMVGIRVGY